jgi:hypothetical protein
MELIAIPDANHMFASEAAGGRDPVALVTAAVTEWLERLLT